jgi:hypothetical protein
MRRDSSRLARARFGPLRPVIHHHNILYYIYLSQMCLHAVCLQPGKTGLWLFLDFLLTILNI